MPVTLKELAARANVHPSTISRVANNDPGLRIATATRSRIEALLRETGYQPNGIARGLKMRQTNVLAVVIPDVTNPFFAALFRGVEDAAAPRGFNVLLCNTDGLPERQRSHLQSLQARRVDGVIIASSFLKDPSVRDLRRQKGPYVLVNRFSDEGEDPFVGLRRSPRRPARHRPPDRSRAHAHRAPRGEIHGQHRACCAGAATSPRTPSPALPPIRASSSRPATPRKAAPPQRGGCSRCPNPPTAMFAVTDMVAIGAAEVARQMGLRIPEDLAIVGYNDIPLASRVSPGLTTMHVPIHEFGSVAARLLLDQIESDEPTRRRVRFTPDLIVRESTVAGAAKTQRSARPQRQRRVTGALTPQKWCGYARQSFAQDPSGEPATEGEDMTEQAPDAQTLGWIGVGRMGEVLATRLLERRLRSDRLQPHQREGQAAR